MSPLFLLPHLLCLKLRSVLSFLGFSRNSVILIMTKIKSIDCDQKCTNGYSECRRKANIFEHLVMFVFCSGRRRNGPGATPRDPNQPQSTHNCPGPPKNGTRTPSYQTVSKRKLIYAKYELCSLHRTEISQNLIFRLKSHTHI